MFVSGFVRFLVMILALATALVAASCAGDSVRPPEPDALRLNDVQVLASHNSYKKPMLPERMTALAEANPEAALSLDYEHIPLEEQLDLGLRKLELDVFNDPEGTLFRRFSKLDEPVEAGAEPLQGEDSPESGFPVLHVQNLDDQSHCRTLTHCLQRLVAWSEDNPDHLPIAVSINAKDQPIEQPGFLVPSRFDESAWQRLDATLRTGLGSKLLQPSEVFASGQLQWPLLSEARGRFLFVLDEGGEKRDAYAASWKERAMFANLPETEPGAAFLIINDPVKEFERIQRLVRQGFLVRTRADADTKEARSGDTSRRDRAFDSGAHFISTDYYLPAKFGTGYVVEFPDGEVSRCNPLRRPEPCDVGRR